MYRLKIAATQTHVPQFPIVKLMELISVAAMWRPANLDAKRPSFTSIPDSICTARLFAP